MSKKRSDWEEYALGQSGVQTGSLMNQQALLDKQMNEKKPSGGGGGGGGCVLLLFLPAALLYSLRWLLQ